MDSEKGWTLLFWAMIIIGVLAVLFRGEDIERDLSERANAALHENGLQWASVKDANGRNLVLSGESPIKAHRGWPLNTVKDLYGVRAVNDEDVSVKAPASPYVWAAIVAPDKITLSGHVPDEDTRTAILEKVVAIISDRPVTDTMVLTDGAPKTGWLENINNILKYTKYLKNGAVHLSDRTVKVEGEAWNSLDFEVIALRASRGRTVNEYAFSSDLQPPENSAGQSLITSAPSHVEADDTDTPNTPAVSEKTGETEDPAKAGSADATPAATAPDDAAVSPEPEEKPADKKEAGVVPGPKASDKSGKSATTGEANEKAKGSASSESATTDKPDAIASKAEPRPADKEKPAETKAAGRKRAQQGQSDSAVNIPSYMIAPPWAFSPYPAPPAGYYRAPPAYYRAPPAYYPNCGYGNPYPPAYCARPPY